MIPQISLGTSLDMGKQLASIRSYLIQLRDAIDDDIHAIGYDNLTQDLRKKIDGLEANINANAQFSNVVAEKLKAEYISAKQIDAQYASVTKLDAAMARIDSIESNYVTTGTLNAQIANLGSVYASQAWVGALDAIVANLRDVRIANLEADHVSIASLNAVNAKFNSLNASNITAGRLSVERLADSNSGNNCTWQYVKLQGEYSTYWAHVLITP